MDNANGSSSAAPRRRRWDDTPAPSHAPTVPSALPPAPPLAAMSSSSASSATAHPAPVNVQEAKRLAALKAAELAAKSLPSTSSTSSASSALPDRPSSLMTTASGFTQDIDINDCRNRYLLTKADTQRAIKAETGCEITTRGQYLPDRAQATAARPPLHLHVSATTRDALDKAMEKIKEMMDRPVDPLLTERASFAPRRHDPRDDDRGEGGHGHDGGFGGRDRRPPPLSEKVFIDFAVNDRRFNVRAKVVGPKGSYVKHIQTTTGVRIQLKGQGSGYTETATGRESDEDLHVHLWTTQPNGEVAMKKAKDLLEDLLSSVRAEYERWSEANSRGRDMMGPGPGGMGNGGGVNVDSYRPGGGDLGGGGDRDRDRPHMDMHFAPSAPSSDYAGAANTVADPYAAYAATASSGLGPAPPAAPQYLHQPPYAAPEPPRHIVKTADDRDKYTEYYAQFYCYYFQLASEGKSMPVVEVPEAPAGSEGEAQGDASVMDQGTEQTEAAAPAAAVGATDGLPPGQAETAAVTGQEGMDPATAAQWQQYYAQYYASMGYSADGSATGTTASADAAGTASAGASAASVPGSDGTADASGGTDHAAQWAAYYAYYGQADPTAAGATGGEEGVQQEQQS